MLCLRICSLRSYFFSDTRYYVPVYTGIQQPYTDLHRCLIGHIASLRVGAIARKAGTASGQGRQRTCPSRGISLPQVFYPEGFGGCSIEDSSAVKSASEGCVVPCPAVQVSQSPLTGLEGSKTQASCLTHTWYRGRANTRTGQRASSDRLLLRRQLRT